MSDITQGGDAKQLLTQTKCVYCDEKIPFDVIFHPKDNTNLQWEGRCPNGCPILWTATPCCVQLEGRFT